MLKHFIITTTLCFLSYPCIAHSQCKGPVKVALLPMQQEQANGPRVPDEQLSTSLLVELTKTGEFQLVESAELEKAVEKGLIDDAVFELLVTNDLTQTLERLDTLCSRVGLRNACAETARRLGADYTIEVGINAGRYQSEITYRLTDTQTNRVSLAESFLTSLIDSRNVAREIANRVTRDLWKLKHRVQPAK